jgi:hypothetical protein
MTSATTSESLSDIQYRSVELALRKKFEKIFDAIDRRDVDETVHLLAHLELAHAGRCGCNAPFFESVRDGRYWIIRHDEEPKCNAELWCRLYLTGMLKRVREGFGAQLRGFLQLDPEMLKNLDDKLALFLADQPSAMWFVRPGYQAYVPHTA